MPIDPNDEILQDFLVEAGELLEGLNEQLIALEQDPENRDLLNAVFRSFHTIKGGAGFLNLTSLVAVCHRAEDVFNLLRNGERKINSLLMDTVLQVLDVLNVMFGDLQAAQEPGAAPPALLAALDQFAVPEDATAAPSPPPVTTPPSPASPVAQSATDEAGDDITEAEYDRLLDVLGSSQQPAPPPLPPKSQANSNSISDDEFEALLDKLKNQGGATVAAPSVAPPPAAAAPLPIAIKAAAPAPAPATAKPAVPPPVKPASPPAAVTNGSDADAGSKAAARQPAAPPAETSVRVDTHRLDEIMNLVGELVLVRNRLSMLRARTADDEVAKAIGSLALVTADLQTAVMKTRMQPIKKVFSRFPRVVRDLARNLGKEIDLETYGEDTDLDKNLVEALADPLVHLVRNAVDHGIEMPDVRASRGKPRKGTVTLGAAQEGDHIALVIEDDGRGMDPHILRDKAVSKGLLDPLTAERMSARDAFNLIFLAGFSTKEEISDVSGRGVGMDVVKTRITQLNGTVEIDSELGRGTTLRIKLPLTLAILPALMVILDKRRFAIPLASVSEILDLDLDRSHFVDEQETMMVRNHALPLVYIAHWVQPRRPPEPHPEAHVVVVHVGQRKVGLVVDGLVGQEEVVIKPLGVGLQGVPGLAGATITGDGGIALILDIPELLRIMGKANYGRRSSRGAVAMAVGA
ncbi:chemotaxis protein CheA [Thiospirillum jenense]|uniref:Chemotaxis protein CheA n=1 Tax=Thiospirillum jenense TaxID=1653858 RepID=A0A839HAA3_9GAMM|nr:chemotaxis protein CheA [Thiospirillum jenense]MBB1125781.1 chemotaxis protein CheA [Thiospirillum jenense]